MCAMHDEILLRNGPLTLGLAPGAGGSITRLQCWRHGEVFDILRPRVAGPARISPALQMSSFPLVPYCGRLRGGRFLFRERPIRFPLNALPEYHSSHGDGFTREWHLLELTEHHALMRLPAALTAPVRYECLQTVTLLKDRVDLVLRARNTESRPIPMELGFHPYFARRSRARVQAELPLETFWDGEYMPVGTGPNIRYAQLATGIEAAQLPEAAEFSGWSGRAAIEWPQDALHVELLTQPALSHVVIWAPHGEDFFCFEPLSHATDSFNRSVTEPDVAPVYELLPGQSREQVCSFVIRFGDQHDCRRAAAHP